MEKHIKESMNDTFLKQAAVLYDVPFKSIEYLGGFENFVYVYTKDEIDYVLRFVHSDHHDYNLVLGEIEFIDYLDKHNASVSTVIHSVNDRVVEQIMINEKDYFTVSVFVKGEGERLGADLKKDEFWEYFGEEVGKLHVLTKHYNPKHRRFNWDEDTLYLMAESVLGETYKDVNQKLQSIIHLIQTYPIASDNFGLIHTDLHIGNMVISEQGKLTFFDFDDSSYKHFISDIAIIIFYFMGFSHKTITEKTELAIKIMKPFIKGYSRHNHLSKKEWLNLNVFFKLREAILFTVIVASGKEIMESPWGSNFMNKYYDEIVDDVDFIDLETFLKGVELI